MMSLREKIIESQKTAMLERNRVLLDTLRNLWSAIKNEEIEKKRILSDEEIQSVAMRLVKQSQDVLQDFKRAGRDDLSDSTEKEIEMLSVYLPEQMSEAEVEKIVNQVVEENKDGELNFGTIMGMVMQRVKGKADGAIVRQSVDKRLNSQ
ncbi:MAG: glutamyl-tRNA amidotransferase [Candidatus Magasanikbacteria bacterium CG_4_9_14_3_um_filter_32_9]|uniref:Glutamyl-tRNA amidotransferase n=1 Tax=Candidatus Magasanikbacteria bacterium CG_4_9_14_3_um_filter_32_9 TaxID=1974644 RepID=A0A2M7Z5Z7_9BACT|nr:MAG: glutamyl-tRNA amidotransferase [Candidatus Magasanikbacteria bacterium CG_4_9_14_3_um_filter_32_9]